MQLCLLHSGQQVGSGSMFTGVKSNARSHRYAGLAEQNLGVVLVHACSRSEDPASDVGQAHHFKQTLQGAVLTVRAVENRKNRVNMTQRLQRTNGPGRLGS